MQNKTDQVTPSGGVDPKDKPNLPAIIAVLQVILFVGFSITHGTMNIKNWDSDDIMAYICTAVLSSVLFAIVLEDNEDEGLDDSW